MAANRKIVIKDDLDLEKIRVSGQAFRISVMDDGAYRFITGEDVLYIRNTNDDEYEISCSEEEFKAVWHDYFDLDRNYSLIRKEFRGRHGFIDESMDNGKGIRILRQDPFEMLITFIISQRKNIPAISASVEKLCERYGHSIDTDREKLYSFPSPEALFGVSDTELRECSLGYRAPYVADAAYRVATGKTDLEGLKELPDEELFNELIKVHGVGKKVANCICLFAYSRVGMVPVDVWIQRAIEERCDGVSPFELFGEYAGIMQQYIFYNMREYSRG